MSSIPSLAFIQTGPEELSIPHEADVNPLTGSAAVRIPLNLTPGRSDFGPRLALGYSSNAGNSPFGLGWSLGGLLTIGVDIGKQLPTYDGRDSFLFSEGGELVPVLRQNAGKWEPRVEDRGNFTVRYFRGRVENTRIRVEQWTEKSSSRIHWRTRDIGNVLTVYGLDPTGKSRIAHPADAARTFSWLPEAQYDPQGNAIQFEYVAEDKVGVDQSLSYERSRSSGSQPQRYLKRIRYGNTKPVQIDAPMPADNKWSFEVVLDYGDHDDVALPTTAAIRPWPARPDPFSNYRPGFEVRSYRLCRRVLLFHRFDALGPQPVLVGMHRLEYDLRPEGSTLSAVHYTRFRRDVTSGVVRQASLQPIRFNYTAPSVARSFEPALPQTSDNVPHGLSGANYRWIDLYGEGLPGILSEVGQAWFYKTNEGDGRFGPQQLVVSRPSHRLAECALTDFDADGNTNLAVLHGRQAGYYEYDRDRESWDSFRALPSLPHLEAAGMRAQWMDLNGDGRADLLLGDPERLAWYPSLGKDGFGPVVEVQRPLGSTSPGAPLADDPTLGFFFADMSGDGLLDQVLVRNGRVEYWPHLGNGRFGNPVLMEGAPALAPEGEFDPSRILLVDLDGKGAADILYLGAGELRYWINAGGNRLIQGDSILNLPYIDNISSARVLDFLGDGTPCLVWSSPLAGQANPIHYLPLTSGVKPRLLLSVDNGMGRQVRLNYASSSTHYLRDKHDGRPWRSRLPGHSMVVDVREEVDQIGGSRSITRYEYHDGYFDGHERAPRGFSLVDRYDSEWHDGTVTAPEIAYTTPACQRTWFHPGGVVPTVPARAYTGDSKQALLTPHSFADLSSLKPGDYEDGLRALAGVVLRQELFALAEAGRLADHPFEVTQHSYHLRRLQPARAGAPACFTFFESEQVTSTYEQQPNDPRVTHDLTLDADPDGNLLLTCSVAYARRPPTAPAAAAQQRLSASARRLRYANFDDSERREVGIPVEEEEFEVAGLTPGVDGLLVWDQLRTDLQSALAAPLDFHQDFTAGIQTKRIGWERTFYWDTAQGAALNLGGVGLRTLLHCQETTCFTTSFISQVFGTRADANLLQTDGGYRLQDGYWWSPGETIHYRKAAGFFELERVERPDGGSTNFDYDPVFLTITEVRDALGNRTRGEIDYHLIAPFRITDPNDNIAEVIYDPFGVIVVSTGQGQVLDSAGNQKTYGQERLSAYTPRAGATFAGVLGDPASFVQKAAQFVYYELDSWTKSAIPPRAIRIVREDLANDDTGSGAVTSRAQVIVSHFDGFRRVLQTKTLVEPGSAVQRDANGKLVLDANGVPVEAQAAIRWLGSGHTVYNRKQQAVRQYEPFYSTLPGYEAEKELAQFGVFSQMQYDATGRLVEEDLPNGTRTRTEFLAWAVGRYDPNDTVLNSLYQALRTNLPDTNLEKQALKKAEAHADTPTILHLDPQGSEVKQVDTSPDGNHHVTETGVELHGKPTAITDPRGLIGFKYSMDMTGRVLLSHSLDAGDFWTLLDIYDRPVHLWDSRGVHQRRRFDTLDRPVSVFVDGALGLNQLTEQLVYGEDASVSQASLRNLRGRLVLHRDHAGTVTFDQYGLSGEVLRSERRLRQLYKEEPDWTNPANVILDAPRYITQTGFDALGRIQWQDLPDGTSRRLVYLQGGGLAQVTVSSADGLVNNLAIMSGSSFNARGQRTSAVLGNGVEVSHTFDPETFRTNRITATRPAGAPGATATLQDLKYVYDPVGNISYSVDEAQQPAAPGRFLQGLNVSPERDFTYDAFYQLTQATGRVHQALLEHDYQPGLTGADAMKGTRHLTFNNGAAVERYTRKYEYDLAGNLRRIKHQGATRNWTTEMWISAGSNRSLPANDPAGNPVSNPESRFDPNGNCTSLAHLRAMDWGYRNTLTRAVVIDRSASGGPDDAEYYVYDGNGLRVRKVTERLVAGQLEVTDKLYLDGCEIKRIRLGPQQVLERVTSHLADGESRIALIHRWTTDTSGRETADVTVARVRYQLNDHLGTSRLELDEQGAVISFEEFFPFGGSAFIAGDKTKEIEIKDYRFCGKERDEGTGLYYCEHRYYAAWIGRWMSPDPIGPEDDHNLYRYVQNNPINFTDPDGLQAAQRGGSTIPRYYIPYELLPASVQNDVNRALGYQWGIPREKMTTFTVHQTQAEFDAAMAQKGGVILVYDPQYQSYFEEATSRGLKEEAAMEIAGIRKELDEALRPISEFLANAPPLPGERDGPDQGSGPGARTGTGTESGGSQNPSGGEHGDDGTKGGAKGAGGEGADAKGTSSSNDPSATGTHSGDGSSTQNTPATGGQGSEGTGTGAGTKGGGKGAGPGGGQGSQSRGSVGGRSAGPEVDAGVPNGTPDGVPGGTSDKTVKGVPGGVPGGQATLLSPSGGILPAAPGQTVNGNDPNGSRTGTLPGVGAGPGQTGETQGTGSGLGSRTSGQRSGGQGAPNAQQGKGSGSEQQQNRTFGDWLMKPFGWANLEFGGGAGGESGGIPGGKGTHNMGGWGQALYAAFTIASLIGAAGIKALFKGLATGLKAAGLFLLRLFTKEFWRSLAVRFGRFFYDPRTFKHISRKYWERFGPADGRSLHHWLIPQRFKWPQWVPERVRRGITNAGWNLLELPPFFRFGANGGLNQWMGFAQKWGGMRAAVAHTIENFIRFVIPASLVGAGVGGYRAGEASPGSGPANPRSGSDPGPQGATAPGVP